MAKQVIAVGNTGTQMVDRLANNFDELYSRGDQNPLGTFMSGSGQSNFLGFNIAATAMVTNPQVFDWQESAFGVDDFAFRVANPNADRGTPSANGFIGMRGIGRGSILWAAADAVQKHTQKPVYMFQYGRGASPIESWASGGLCDVLVQAEAAAALAAAGFAKADHFVWCQGETDASLNTPSSSYAGSVVSGTITRAEVAGLIGSETKICVVDIPVSWGRWSGALEAVKFIGRRASYIDTLDRPVDGNGDHYLGDTYNAIGREDVAKNVLFGTANTGSNGRGTQIYTTNARIASAGTMDCGVIDGKLGAGGSMGAALITVAARNAAKSAYYHGVWRVFYMTDGTAVAIAAGTALVSESGAAGFAMAIINFGGIAGFMQLSVPTGDWTVCVTVHLDTPKVAV